MLFGIKKVKSRVAVSLHPTITRCHYVSVLSEVNIDHVSELKWIYAYVRIG